MNKHVFDTGLMAPFSKESEYSVLGSILHTRNKIHEAMSLVDVEDFWTETGRDTYKAMVNTQSLVVQNVRDT
jgi:replicative DNA helicase